MGFTSSLAPVKGMYEVEASCWYSKGLAESRLPASRYLTNRMLP